MGKSSKTSTTVNDPSANILAQLAQQLFGETDPSRKSALSILNELLTSGRAGQNVPMIQQATAGARSGLAQSLDSSKAKLGQLGLGSDPASQALLSQIAATGEQGISEIGPDMNMQLLQLLLGQASPNAALSGLAGAKGGQQKTTTSAPGSGGAGIGSLLGLIAGSAVGAPIVGTAAGSGFGSLFG